MKAQVDRPSGWPVKPAGVRLSAGLNVLMQPHLRGQGLRGRVLQAGVCGD